MESQVSEKFRISGMVRCGQKRVTVLSGSGENKVQLVFPRTLLESFLSGKGAGFESVTRVSWDKDDFVLVKDRWFHKSLVTRTGKSLKSKMYRTANVRVSDREFGLCTGLLKRALGKAWVGDLALVSREVLVSQPFGNSETVADRMVRVLVKNCLDRGLFQRYGIVGGEVTGWNYRKCETYLWWVVKNWVVDLNRWLNRRCSMKSRESRIIERDSGLFALPDRDKLFVERLFSLKYYQ